MKDYPVRWGLFDRVDKLWMGTEKGPVVHTDLHLAQVAALCLEKQMGWIQGRVKVKEMEPGKLRQRDVLPTLMSTEEALTRLEEGR